MGMMGMGIGTRIGMVMGMGMGIGMGRRIGMGNRNGNGNRDGKKLLTIYTIYVQNPIHTYPASATATYMLSSKKDLRDVK